MKNFKTYVLLALGIIIAGCSEDDKATVVVQETVTSGAILRTLSATGGLDMFDTASTLAFSIQEQDAEGGDLLDRVEITASFVDNNGTDSSVSNAALATIAASEFGETEGLPSFEYSVTMAEVLSATGVALTDVLPGDQFVIDMELFLTDGRSFKNSDTTGKVSGGSFFSSPYQYTFPTDDGIAFGIEDVNANEVSLTNPNEDYSVTITIDDGNDQALVETLNLYRAFVDRSIVDDVNLSEPEALFDTWNIADLDIADGVSSLDLVITLDDLYGPNLTFDDLGVNDEFQLRYEIVTADGRIVTTDENDTEYYRAVFVTECVQLNADAPFPGEYTINHFDSYGDGWNGAAINVQIDGGDVVPYTLENGDNGTSTFTVPEGATTLVITYTPGDWEGEVSYTIQDPNLKTAASDGPNPAVGEITILVCE